MTWWFVLWLIDSCHLLQAPRGTETAALLDDAQQLSSRPKRGRHEVRRRRCWLAMAGTQLFFRFFFVPTQCRTGKKKRRCASPPDAAASHHATDVVACCEAGC